MVTISNVQIRGPGPIYVGDVNLKFKNVTLTNVVIQQETTRRESIEELDIDVNLN